MNIPAWIWFLTAVITAAAGCSLLFADYAWRNTRGRERKRWAALRGWQFAEAAPISQERWLYGALADTSPTMYRDVVIGTMVTGNGSRRAVHVFDQFHDGRLVAVVVALRSRKKMPTVAELWLPDAPFPRKANLELLGPAGNRYAFVTNVSAGQPLITPEVIEAADDLGDDVMVVWFEEDWVLLAALPTTNSLRLERLLRDLGELADILDPTGGANPLNVTEFPTTELAITAPTEPSARFPYTPMSTSRLVNIAHHSSA